MLVHNSLVCVYDNWEETLKFFEVRCGKSLRPAMEISQFWAHKMSNGKSEWWELGIKIIRCCNERDAKVVHNRMINAVSYNNDSKHKPIKYVCLKLCATVFYFRCSSYTCIQIIWRSSIFMQGNGID